MKTITNTQNIRRLFLAAALLGPMLVFQAGAAPIVLYSEDFQSATDLTGWRDYSGHNPTDYAELETESGNKFLRAGPDGQVQAVTLTTPLTINSTIATITVEVDIRNINTGAVATMYLFSGTQPQGTRQAEVVGAEEYGLFVRGYQYNDIYGNYLGWGQNGTAIYPAEGNRTAYQSLPNNGDWNTWKLVYDVQAQTQSLYINGSATPASTQSGIDLDGVTLQGFMVNGPWNDKEPWPYFDWDNIEISYTPVPESGTVMMLGMAGVAFWLRRRTRRH